MNRLLLTTSDSEYLFVFSLHLYWFSKRNIRFTAVFGYFSVHLGLFFMVFVVHIPILGNHNVTAYNIFLDV